MVNLKRLFKYTKEDSLIRDSFILFVATMITNLGAFLYHFVMGRFLGPSAYGTLGVVLSLFYILLVPFYVIQTSLSKFVSEFKAKNDNKSISNLFYKSTKKLLVLGLITSVVSIVISFSLADFFKIPVKIIWIVALSIPFLFLLPIVRGVLQGKQMFKSLGINMIIEAFSKFLIGLLFVFLGFGIFGAVFGIAACYISAFLFGFLVLRRYYKKSNKKLNTKMMYKYSLPVFIVLLTLTLFYSLDVMLVKHYFNDLDAGYYSAFALLGRIAFFASYSIVFVLFPKVAEMHALGKQNLHILKKAMLLSAIVSAAIILSYLLLPKLVVLILFGSKYIAITKYITAFALLMSLFSFVYLLAFYNLSIDRTSFVYYLFLLDIFEVLAIWKFHSSLWQVIISLLILISISLICMLYYTFKKNGKIINNNTLL